MTDSEARSENLPHQEAGTVGARPGSPAKLLALLLFLVIAGIGFAALGTWQLYRLQWKLALIERVEARVHAAPVAAPGPDRWSRVTAESDEYRHVRLTGVFLHALTTRVQAVTDYGSGYWLLTPLRMADGNLVLVNRGFVPARETAPDRSDREQGRHGEDAVTVTGLLRISEPGGGFLRRNDPGRNRWYSRDVRAISAARGLSPDRVAPYFVDADAGPDREGKTAPGQPVGGLTVVAFHNNHLGYALTWYALALMAGAGGFYLLRNAGRRQPGAAPHAAPTDSNDEENG